MSIHALTRRSALISRCAVALLPLAMMSAGCATVEERALRFSSLSCDQLATALAYEKRAERKARVSGAIAGVASIFEDGSDETLLELDSEADFIESDDRRLSVKAIRAEQQRRCAQ